MLSCTNHACLRLHRGKTTAPLQSTLVLQFRAHMDVLDEIAHLLSEYGLSDADVKRLVRGLEFDMDQMAVRDALGGNLSVAQKQFIRSSIISGTRLIDIVAALRSSVAPERST